MNKQTNKIRLIVIYVLMAIMIVSCGSTGTSLPTPQAVVSATKAYPTETHLPPTSTTIPATNTAVPTETVTQALREPPPGYKLYNSPYWITFYYPEDWIQVSDDTPGDIGLATEESGEYTGPLPEARFNIYPIEEGDPMSLIQGGIANLSKMYEGINIEEQPKTILVNNQNAAIAVFSQPRIDSYISVEEGGLVTKTVGTDTGWLMVIEGTDRLAVVLAYCYSERKDTYQPIFDIVLSSLVLREKLANPIIKERSTTPPENYKIYRNETQGIQLYHPAAWQTTVQDNSLILAPHGNSPTGLEYSSLFVASIEDIHELVWPPGDEPEDLVLWWMETIGRGSSSFNDAVMVTGIVREDRNNQRIARALFSGTVDGEPALAIVTGIRYDNKGILAFGYIEDYAEIAELELIMDTITFIGDNGAQPSATIRP
jgi:hypothetical protein